jgi:putative membrane protein
MPGVAMDSRSHGAATDQEEGHNTMIERYSDHAANERTFLAWVRTAIAIMAFGFLVEKFDLFVSLASRQMGDKQVAHTPAIGGQTLGNLAGLVLILLGGATLALAIVRFRKTAADIDSAERRQGPGERLDITLGGLLVLLGAAMAVYLVYTTISKF